MSDHKPAKQSPLQWLHHRGWGRIVIGLSIGLLIVALKLPIEHTAPYAQIRLAMYGFVQGTFQADEEAAVQLVDTSAIATEEDMSVSPGEPAVSRRALLDVLSKIANDKPRAIGVDVDFSPDESGNPVTMDDHAFFQEVQGISTATGVPIFLGVHRHAAGGPADWLGDPRFAHLAAGLGVGNEDLQAKAGGLPTHVPSVLRMLTWTRPGESGEPLKSLAFAMANQELRTAGTPPKSLNWAIEYMAEFRPSDALTTQGFLVNYRMLDRLVATQIPVDEVDAIDGVWAGKYVILGDVRRSSAAGDDMFQVPGRSGYYSGTLLHGCAIDTLVSSPLNQWTHNGRIAVDLLVALLGILTIEFFKWIRFGRRKVEPPSHRLEWVVTLFYCLLVLMIAVPYASSFRLMWDDAIVVALCLLIHTGLDIRLSKSLHQHAKHP